MHSLMWQPVVLGFVGLHLHDEVDEVLWLGEELKLLGIDKVAELILNLDDQLDDVETVKSVIGEQRVNTNRCFLGCSEIVLND